MSKKLLIDLNGDKRGILYNFLNNLTDEPRIAWYPSAGEDFRPLIYLHENYAHFAKIKRERPAPPNFFIYTDYYPWDNSSFLDSKTINVDENTFITIESIEELPKVNLSLDSEIVDFPNGGMATNRVVFLNVKIESSVLGLVRYPVLYVFAQNESFYCHKIIPNNGRISHLIHVRYGGSGCGGGQSSGAWLVNVLERIDCEIFITDNHHYWNTGDERATQICQHIPKDNPKTSLHKMYKVNSAFWSNHGDVIFYKVGDSKN